MGTVHSLDDLISKKAIKFANEMRAVAATADKEEEIRIAVEKQLAFIEKEAEITLEGKHEFTVASGFVDSVYDRVIIEYKNPCSPSDRIGPKASSTGSKKVVKQIKRRFYDMRAQYEQPLNTLFGVGFDGNYFIFIRFRDDKWQVQDPVELNRYSAERFLSALFNLGKRGKPFSPDYLADDFGSEARLSQDSIYALYNAIVATKNPKAQVFFSQWKILFGEVCGYDVDNPSDRIKKLAKSYGIPLKGLKPAELLFALHTYYAIFMKLLASQIVTYSRDLPTPLQNMIKASTSNKLRREMEDLEAGSIFRHLNITNFLEGDLFAWYTSVWSEPIEELVRNIVTKLDNYNPGTLSEDPSVSRDLLKKLYQQLFPKSVRHDLGEYYTPDWLAEHVLNELSYIGNPDKRLLDPACGSGTFLVMAINRIRKWYDENRENRPFGEDGLCRKILTNVVGFDLNPLAVMAARTNYLIAIRDLIAYVDKVEIPVYLCDSIMTPSEYGGLFARSLGKAKELKTAAATFVIPTEIATKREDIAKYAEQLEFCVLNSYSPKEFINRCQDEGLPIETESLHTDIYRELVKLDKVNKNGIWARIIKNAFAPLFTNPVDYVVGNPPWIRWGYLPQQYRTDIEFLWRQYRLFTQKGLESRMGTAEVDISILFTYACVDVYLKKGGLLGFLITQEVIRSKSAGEGFRAFKLFPSETPLKVNCFHDLVAVKPFEAANKSAFISITKNKQTKYPVPYIEWRPKKGQSVSPDDTLEQVFSKTTRSEKMAKPLHGHTSPWQVMTATTAAVLSKLEGESSFRGRCGVSIDPYGVFLCKILSIRSDQSLIVTNDPSLGKADVPQMPPSNIEPDRVFPVVRGRDIRKWLATPLLAGIILNSSTRKEDIPTEKDVKRTLPKTYGYLFKMRNCALNRAKFWQFFSRRISSDRAFSDEEIQALGAYGRTAGKSADGRFIYEVANGPFFALFNVGQYTFAPFKVCWPMGASSMRAAVVENFSFEVDGGRTASRCVIPSTGTTSYVPFYDDSEAHYLCALLNSVLVNAYIRSFSSAGRGFGAPSVVGKINLPNFDPKSKLHRSLSELSRKCHKTLLCADSTMCEEFEAEIDKTAAKLWGITDDELKAIQDTL